MSKTVGDLIRENRQMLGYSKAQLARLLNISPAAVSQWEANKTSPELPRWKEVAYILELDLNDEEISQIVYEQYGIVGNVRVGDREHIKPLKAVEPNWVEINLKDVVRSGAQPNRLKLTHSTAKKNIDRRLEFALKTLQDRMQEINEIKLSEDSSVVHADAIPYNALTSLARDVPVYGIAVGGTDGDFQFNGQDIDMVLRPSGLRDARGIFAVYVSNDSMYPAWKEGSLCYVNPNRPPMIGDDVIIEIKPSQDGEPSAAYIKRLKARTPTKIIVEQFNPPRDIEFDRDEIVRMYRVVPWEEALGLS